MVSAGHRASRPRRPAGQRAHVVIAATRVAGRRKPSDARPGSSEPRAGCPARTAPAATSVGRIGGARDPSRAFPSRSAPYRPLRERDHAHVVAGRQGRNRNTSQGPAKTNRAPRPPFEQNRPLGVMPSLLASSWLRAKHRDRRTAADRDAPNRRGTRAQGLGAAESARRGHLVGGTRARILEPTWRGRLHARAFDIARRGRSTARSRV